MAEVVDRAQVQKFLRQIWAFELLEPQHLGILAGLVGYRRLRAGEILWLQGQNVTYFTIVFSGKIRAVRRSSSGSEKLVSALRPGQHFGLAEMITQASSAVTLIADEPSVILTMDRQALRKELLSNAEICYRLMQTMARAIFGLTRELERASFERVTTRLARLLLRQGAARSTGSGGSAQAFSHAELAVRLGVSRETISRVLGEFKQKGLINTGYRRITVRDRDGLMTYVEDYDQW